MTRPGRQHALPGGGSALKPPTRDLAAPPERPAAPGSPTPSFPPEGQPVPASDVAPPPPAVRRYPREQLNTKIRVDLRQRLNAFVTRHESTLQGVLEAALDEYMARRGWTWDDYHRSTRHG